jgi:hypothetical protein
MANLPRFADNGCCHEFFKLPARRRFGFLLKGGADVSPAGGAPVATMVIQDRNTLAGLLRDPEVSFGDAYMDGRIEVEGDLVRFLEAIYRAMETRRRGKWYSRLASKWMDFAGQLAPRIAQQYPPPLRFGERFL